MASASTVQAGTLAAGGALTFDQVVAGSSSLTVISRIGNATTPATASSDNNTFIMPFLSDRTTLSPQGVSAVTSGTSLSAGTAWVVKQFNLCGIERIRMQLGNANVAALQGAQIDWFIS